MGRKFRKGDTEEGKQIEKSEDSGGGQGKREVSEIGNVGFTQGKRMI